MGIATGLRDAFPTDVRQRGQYVFATNCVQIVSADRWSVRAVVQGTRKYEVELYRDGNEMSGFCECPYFDGEGVCKHLWATILAADRKQYLVNGNHAVTFVNPEWDVDDDDGMADEEAEFWDLDGEPWSRPARGRTAPKPKAPRKPPVPAWRKILNELQPAPAANGDYHPWRAGNEIYYVVDISRTYSYGVCVAVNWRELLKNGNYGKIKDTRIPRDHIMQIGDQRDRDILMMLGGVPDYYGYGTTSINSVYHLGAAQIRLFLPRMCATGRCRIRTAGAAAVETLPELIWDDGPPWRFRVTMERQDNHWNVTGCLERGEERRGLDEAHLFLPEGLVFLDNRVCALDHSGGFSWIALLRKNAKLEVPIKHGNDFVTELLGRPSLPPIEWPDELKYEHVTVPPQPSLKLEQPDGWHRQRDILWADLSFDYNGRVFRHDDSRRGEYQAAERRFLARDAAAEQTAKERLKQLGVKYTNQYRWELAGKKLPKIIAELVQDGWKIESEGKLFRSAGEFHAELSSGIDWFELDGEIDFGTEQVKLPELLSALQRGDNLIHLKDGSYGVVPQELQDKYGFLIRLGHKEGEAVRFSRAQAGVLDVLLAGRPEIRVDQMFTRIREELQRFNGIEAAPQPDGFVGQLRDYQLDGLAWIHFLRQFRFGGCLADDMGVGKTPQVLALLETRRLQRQSQPDIGPSLAVVPRSLVYNWKREAERFTPQLRVLDHTGIGRSKTLENFNDHDLILTTYGTLRRDAAVLQAVRFDYAILDEAQAIKNASTESAKAARLLQADHRLALSGTPVENHLGELWSLFEFLNPGMLGGVSVFSAAADRVRKPDDPTREILAKAVRPFILRRTKDQVARELPAKTEQTVYCELDATQRRLYNELRDHYRAALMDRIDRDGMARAQIQILEALLRLRQAACHPGLFDPKRRSDPSAKLEALLPQLTEVMQEGHKALVFSQFTSFLGILREQLDAAKIAYEYLDGQTRDRETCVNHFQDDPDCKLFLVSLKAGGVGLNLCAAEYVFLLDPWWNPAVESQAIDRAHRIGQTKPVFAYRLIARETVEEKVIELQNSKRDLADAIIRADTRLVGNLKREDLELLLS